MKLLRLSQYDRFQLRKKIFEVEYSVFSIDRNRFKRGRNRISLTNDWNNCHQTILFRSPQLIASKTFKSAFYVAFSLV